MGTTAEKLAYLNDTKTAIKDAIISNGIDVPDDTTFRSYPDKVNQIVGQFDSTLDEIIGGEIVPVLDIEKRLAAVNGISGDVNTQLDTLDSTKAEIAAAITEKGVTVGADATFSQYPDYIRDIKSGGEAHTTSKSLTYSSSNWNQSITLDIPEDATVAVGMFTTSTSGIQSKYAMPGETLAVYYNGHTADLIVTKNSVVFKPLSSSISGLPATVTAYYIL